MTNFILSHAGRGALGVLLAALLLAWPPSCSWIMAVYLLLWAIDHLRMAFREAEHAELARGDGAVAVPARPFTEAEIARLGVPARQPADGAGGVPARP